MDCIDETIFKIPWGHHIQIIGKCRKDVDKALFYVHKTLENNWSRAVLLNFLDMDLYERQGKAISNFSKVLPDVKSDLAQQMTKEVFAVCMGIGLFFYSAINIYNPYYCRYCITNCRVSVA